MERDTVKSSRNIRARKKKTRTRTRKDDDKKKGREEG